LACNKLDRAGRDTCKAVAAAVTDRPAGSLLLNIGVGYAVAYATFNVEFWAGEVLMSGGLAAYDAAQINADNCGCQSGK
jgi:hypothetical protein